MKKYQCHCVKCEKIFYKDSIHTICDECREEKLKCGECDCFKYEDITGNGWCEEYKQEKNCSDYCIKLELANENT